MTPTVVLAAIQPWWYAAGVAAALVVLAWLAAGSVLLERRYGHHLDPRD